MPMLIREVNDGFSVWGDRVLGGLLAARPKGRTQAEALMRDGGLLDILIVGGGPAGLAAAIAAHKAEMNYQVLEKGTLVNSIFNFPSNMVFFTTPELLEIGGLPFTSPYQKPTREEALRYYRKAADLYELRINLGEQVRNIARMGTDGSETGVFEVAVQASDDPGRVYRSKVVVVATGYFDHPNLLGIPGEDLPHVSHYYSAPHPYYRKRVVVVGGANSAAEAALDLYRAGAKVTLVHRGSKLGDAIKYWVRPDIVNRIKEGSISVRFNARVTEIKPGTVVLESSQRQEELPADGVLLLTGYHPDVDLLRRAGVRVDETRCLPEHDPATLETNVPGLYLAGAIVAGKETNRVFIEAGRFHGEKIVNRIREAVA